MLYLLHRLFEDKRLTCVLLMTWMVMVLGIFSELGVMDSNFMTLGPGDHSKIMGMEINTWYKWNCVAVFTFISTSINDFVGDAISPWIQNTIQDHKTKFLPYSKFTCIMITQIWSLYCCVMNVFALFVMLSQVDFLLIRICADLIVNVYTCHRFMKGKTVDPERYAAWIKAEGPGHTQAHCFHTPEPGIIISSVAVRQEKEETEEKHPNENEEPERRGKSMDRLLIDIQKPGS